MNWLVTFGETMGLCTSRTFGPLGHGNKLDLAFGGAESNVAIGLRRLGIPTAWFGRIGDDDLGQLALKGLRGEGVDVSEATIDPELPTGLMVKFSPRHGKTAVIYYRRDAAVTTFGAADLPRRTIADAKMLHVTGISPALGMGPYKAVFEAIAHARSCGTRVSLDLNYRSQLWGRQQAEPILRELIAQADIVLLGRTEAQLLGGERAIQEVTTELAMSGPTHVIAKLGADGVVASIDGRYYTVPGWPAVVVDPVGAGDGFAVGYLSALHDELPPYAALERGLSVAAVVVSTHGDWEGMPRRADLPLVRQTCYAVER